MAYTNLVTGAAGDAGAGDAAAVSAGILTVVLADSDDLTSTKIAIEYSEDGSTLWVPLQANATPANNDILFRGMVNTGFIRENITAGFGADNIDIDFKNEALALEATLATTDGKIDTIDTEVGVIDGNVDTLIVRTTTGGGLFDDVGTILARTTEGGTLFNTIRQILHSVTRK